MSTIRRAASAVCVAAVACGGASAASHGLSVADVGQVSLTKLSSTRDEARSAHPQILSNKIYGHPCLEQLGPKGAQHTWVSRLQYGKHQSRTAVLEPPKSLWYHKNSFDNFTLRFQGLINKLAGELMNAVAAARSITTQPVTQWRAVPRSKSSFNVSSLYEPMGGQLLAPHTSVKCILGSTTGTARPARGSLSANVLSILVRIDQVGRAQRTVSFSSTCAKS